MASYLKSTASPRHLELRLPALPDFLALVELAAHIYVTAAPGGTALGKEVEKQLVESARDMVGDGVNALIITMEIDTHSLYATISTEEDSSQTIGFEWRIEPAPHQVP